MGGAGEDKTIFASNYHLLLAIWWDLFKICHFVIQQWGWGWVIGWVSWYWLFSDRDVILDIFLFDWSNEEIFVLRSLIVVRLKMLRVTPGVATGPAHCGQERCAVCSSGQGKQGDRERVTQTKNWGMFCVTSPHYSNIQHSPLNSISNDYICLTFHRNKIFCSRWSLY